ncbi:NUDIX hydrolase [Falsiruegeria litorea]|uniref:NUDIX hydrolase n=1 Tax=Falsiruegeria litorea TaxID=1280831 RepID=UPI001BFD388A|nr:NUDIX hydrolase [Falsiruegeria litorea]MBT8168265.1 NUDIX hydrolase [Falsiruegeria litorea]
MTEKWTKAWHEVVRPLIQRPYQVQVAALCLRSTPKGQEVLLITSRGTGRWIVPKGWHIAGMNGAEAAVQEAWEEAGVKTAGYDPEPVGQYRYDKKLFAGVYQPVRANVYRIDVAALSDDYPEAGQRERRWISTKEAANLVREPQLQALLRHL